MSSLFIVRLWRRSRLLGGISTFLAVVVLVAGTATLAGLYHPSSNQSMIWATATGFTLGLWIAAQTLLPDLDRTP